MEQSPDIRVEYKEYNLDKFTEQILAIYYEALLDHELSEDQRTDRIQDLVHYANMTLYDEDVTDCPAIIHSGALILPEADEDPVTVDGIVYGEYRGINLLITKDEDDRQKVQLFHVLEIVDIETEQDLPEEFDSPFAMAPIESFDLELLRAPITRQGNENWLRGVCTDLYYTGEDGVQTFEIDDMYERIKKAKYSKYGERRNIDWLFEQLSLHTPFKNIDVVAYTSESFVSTYPHGEVPRILEREEEIEGYMVGFAEMDDYEVVSVEQGIPVISKIEGSKIIAACIETEDEEGVERLVRIPLRMCSKLAIDTFEDDDEITVGGEQQSENE